MYMFLQDISFLCMLSAGAAILALCMSSVYVPRYTSLLGTPYTIYYRFMHIRCLCILHLVSYISFRLLLGFIRLYWQMFVYWHLYIIWASFHTHTHIHMHTYIHTYIYVCTHLYVEVIYIYIFFFYYLFILILYIYLYIYISFVYSLCFWLLYRLRAIEIWRRVVHYI